MSVAPLTMGRFIPDALSTIPSGKIGVSRAAQTTLFCAHHGGSRFIIHQFFLLPCFRLFMFGQKIAQSTLKKVTIWLFT